jgi:hypothetical protein
MGKHKTICNCKVDTMKPSKIFRKVVSSTLIEVITALIIISTVFSLAIIIYLNVQRSGLSAKRLTCNMLMDDVYTSTLRTKKYVSSQSDYENIIVYQEVSAWGTGDGLLIVRLEARDTEGKLLAEQKHLVYVVDKP